MKTIEVQVPDDFEIPEGYEVKIDKKEEPIIRTSQDLIDDDALYSTKYNDRSVVKAILLIVSIILVFIIVSYLTVAVIQWDISWIVNAEPFSRILFVGCMIAMAVVVCGCADI